MVSADVLSGWTLRDASCCGMPHHGAYYTADDIRRYRMEDGARCLVCGKPAKHVHHEPEKRLSFTMRTKWGWFVLKPALIALCPDCHRLRSNKRIWIDWVWNDGEHEERWFDGHLLAHGYLAHSKRLYELGKWEIRRS